MRIRVRANLVAGEKILVYQHFVISLLKDLGIPRVRFCLVSKNKVPLQVGVKRRQITSD